MEVAGSSRPASGSEHLISHAYDSIAARPSLHGLQVGVATIATTWLQNNPAHHTVIQVLDETGFSAFLAEHPLDRAAFTEAVRLATTIKPGYHTVLSEPGAVAQTAGVHRRGLHLGRFSRLTGRARYSNEDCQRLRGVR